MEVPRDGHPAELGVAREGFPWRHHPSLKNSHIVESRRKFTKIGTVTYDMCMYFR